MEELLERELSFLYGADITAAEHCPMPVQTATSTALLEVFKTHFNEVIAHATKLEGISAFLQISLLATPGVAMHRLVDEWQEAIHEDGTPLISDLALIATALNVINYKTNAYRTAFTLFAVLSREEVIKPFAPTLKEVATTESRLVATAQHIVKFVKPPAAK